MNLDLPTKVDEYTEMTGAAVSVDPLTIIYNYRLLVDVPTDGAQVVRNTLTRTQKPNVTQAACSQDATRKGLLEDGVNMHYNYFDGLWLAGSAAFVKVLTVVQFWELWHNRWRGDREPECGWESD